MEHLEILREAFDRCQVVDLADYSPHVAASVMKLFLQCLPTAPLPRGLLEQFPEFAQRGKELARQTLALFALLMPLLRAVAPKAQHTRMTIVNLARAITPSLVRLSILTDESPEMVTYNGGETNESSATLVEDAQQQMEYVANPVETMRILKFNMKVFECLIYYWDELPCSVLGDGGEDEDGRGADDEWTIGCGRRGSVVSRSSSSKQLPRPVPLK
ncbi:Rho GTPase activation protein [Limtongia smithiae]|uniref:Rho GTPase activation protein n=1 Tax=Limtongia smithiae TaxID=1125753 RepID=UPI0034CF6F30